MSTSYDDVAYPSKLFALTHPDRLRMFGKLHGLSPARVETARVLEVGCGEGYNLLGLAAAYPRARLEGFDLAATAVAIGQEQAKAADLGNVVLSVGDIVEIAETVEPGAYDYIIAHGVYAWVPEVVREALLRLAARALTPHGIAFVSYNAMPGGHFRMAMRDLLLHEVGHIADPAEKLAAAKAVLTELSEADAKGEVAIETLKVMARQLLEKHEIVFFHDELGGVYAPHSLTAMAANGARAGLRYLTDSDYVRVYEAFAEGDVGPDVDRTLIRKAQARDNRNACFFRSSLFVRSDAPVRRTLDLSVLDDLWISSDLKFDADKVEFTGDGRRIKLADGPITEAFRQVIEAYPGRVPLRAIITDERWREVFLKLFSIAYADFHASPAPFAATIGEWPESSAFARFEIARGRTLLPRLDHSEVNVEQEEFRALLAAADGKRTIAEIARALDGVFPEDEVVPALNAAAGIALMRT